MELLNSLIQVKENRNPYRIWEIEQQKKELVDGILRQKYPLDPKRRKEAERYSKTVVDIIDIMDKHSLDRTEDMSLVIKNYSTGFSLMSILAGIGLGSLFKKTKIAVKLPDWRPYWELLGLVITTSISSAFINLWQANTAKRAARLARFHTRENELNDYRNFVIYNNQQVEEAKKHLPNITEDSDEKKINLSRQHFNPYLMHKNAKITKNELEKDEINYKEWKEKYVAQETKKAENFHKLNKKITKEDIKKAQKDRDMILRTIKKVETYSNEYSINMEMATYALSASVVAGVTLIGAGISSLLGLARKHINNKPSLNKGIKITQLALVTIIPGITAMTMTAPSVKLIKDAARIGRYKAKQELLSNPEEFITFSDEERKTVDTPNIKPGKNNTWKQLKEDVRSIMKFRTDANEYYNYLDTKYKDETKLKKALKKVDITKEQEKEAKIFQRKLFYAFEKIDEKQVSLVEDTGAAIDFMRDACVSVIDFAIKLVPIYLCAKDVKRINKGNMPKTLKEVFNVAMSGKLKTTTVIAMVLPFILPKFIAYYAIIKGLQLKKEAGNIGVMTAMKDLDDPKNFIVDK